MILSTEGGLTTKLCENTKNYKFAYPGSNKVVYRMGPVNKNPKKKNLNFGFLNMKH